MLAVKRLAAGLLLAAIASAGCAVEEVAAGTQIVPLEPSPALIGSPGSAAELAVRPRALPIDYDVFHSVAIPVETLPAFAESARFAPAAGGAGAGTCADISCETSAGRRLALAAAQAARLPRFAAIRLINSEVNQAIRYQADAGDHWASLAETAARGAGDCEDYAIAKWELLRSIGFAPEQLQFIVVRDTRKQLYHAVLAVHLGGKRFILDNMSSAVARDEIFRTYMPIVSFVGEKSFIHGFAGRGPNAAVLRHALSGSIRPGGGN